MRIRMVFFAALLWSMSGLSACMQDGQLEITLDVEKQETELNPLEHSSLSSFTLAVATEFYADKATDFYYSGRQKLDFGKVAVGKYSRIALTATSFWGATLAYGEVRGRFEIAADKPTRVEIPLRYPFVYAAGGYGLPPIHPELDRSMASFLNVPVGVLPETTTAAAVSPDGLMLVAATDNKTGGIRLWVLNTRNHKKIMEFQIPKQDPVYRMAFSPDGSLLSLVSLTGGWAAFVDMNALLGGSSLIAFEYASGLVDGAFVDNSTWVGLQSAPYGFSTCNAAPGSSTLVWIGISRRSTLELEKLATVPLAQYASSLAVDSSARKVYLAFTCSSEVAVTEPGAVQAAVVLSTLNLSPCLRPVRLTVGQSELLVACATRVDVTSPQWAPAKLLVQRFSLRPQLNPNGRAMVVDFPWEPFNLSRQRPQDHPGAVPVLQLAPVQLLPRDMGLTAAGSRLALSVEAYYYTNQFSDGVSIDETSVKSHSVALVDPRMAQLGRRVRTACFSVVSPEDNNLPAGLAPDEHCSTNNGAIDVTPVSFIPTQLAITFAAP